jgi:hypothetical protein
MAPCGGKGGILHLSYLWNELGDPIFFFCMFLLWAFHKLHPWDVSANSHFQSNYWWITFTSQPQVRMISTLTFTYLPHVKRLLPVFSIRHHNILRVLRFPFVVTLNQ